MDKFKDFTDTSTSPAREAYAVTPNDTTDLSPVPKALYIGGAGDLVITPVDSSVDVTLKGVTAGSIIPIRAVRVKTSSTATFLVAFA